MPERFFALIRFSLLLLLALAGCSKQETLPQPTTTVAPAGPQSQASASPAKVTSTGVVKASAMPVEMTAGGNAEATVQLKITRGYHINANPPSESYLKATEVTVEAGAGISAGKPAYPSSVMKKFSFAEKPLAVYEDEVQIKLPLRAAKTATKGARQMPMWLRVQACDETACYPPGTLDLNLQLTVK
ncbi:MAG TPA: protein-disulfide reductase DsbD domain-containing protein [Pyrinomonadaceae bacterium]|jgi:hypothetical protein